MADESGTKTCPSARCETGATLLGIVNAAGEVSLLGNTMAIDETFVQTAQTGRSPEQRFRFANKCVKSGCTQWTGTRCGVIDNVLNQIEEKYWKENLPSCAIRPTCRWFSQSGADACRVCTYVITDTIDM
jgi:hypothetical protein